MIKVKFIDDVTDCNNNNLEELTPFRLMRSVNNNRICILCNASFYNEIVDTSVMKILVKDYDLVIENDAYRIADFKIDTDDEDYWKIYHTLVNWMSVENWCHVLSDKYALIKLDAAECLYLIDSIKHPEF